MVIIFFNFSGVGEYLGAFIVKGAKDCVYTNKILHPHDFEK
jgi:hypothetical protein